MSLGTFRNRPIRRRWVFGTTTTLVAAVMALFIASASGVLSGSPSSFEAQDGDMVAGNHGGTHDWANVSFFHVVDLASSQSDDSFVSGQKQDTTCPDTYQHGNPPKDDFTDVASFSETNTTSGSPQLGHTFLYGATIRYAANGNASENIELKQGLNNPRLCTNGLLARTLGDKLIAIDYLNGGTNVQFNVLTWITSSAGFDPTPNSDPTDDIAGTCFVGTDSPPCWSSTVKSLGANAAEGQASQAAITSANDPIANSPDQSGAGLTSAEAGQSLAAGQFAEFGVDLTAAGIIPANTCTAFPQTIWESRSSGSSFVSTTKDVSTENHTISNCGSLSVSKYIDSNENGAKDSGDATPLSGDLTGWSFTVTGPNSFSCTGSTDSSGNLSSCGTADLTALAPGTYAVQENANAGKTIGSNSSAFFNTDPGPAPKTPPVSKTNITVGLSGSANAVFGNTCYATASFEVDSVPSGESGLFARYTITSGPDQTATAADVLLSPASAGSSTYTGSAANNLRKGDVISWSYGINHGLSTEQTKAVAATFTLSGYPTCGGSANVNFATSTISGVKYKDINGDGIRQTATEGGLQGFDFQLKSGSTVVTDTHSDSTGAFSFTSVAPGTYTIHEVGPPTGWVQTQPASGDITVTVNLGDGTVSTDTSGNAILFGDTPLSKITVTFSPEAKLLNANGTASSTDATKATAISCSHGVTDVGSNTNSNTNTTNDLQLNKSSVTCTVTFTDP
jgi:hypothetical protein